jgi:hypothetical protein
LTFTFRRSDGNRPSIIVQEPHKPSLVYPDLRPKTLVATEPIEETARLCGHLDLLREATDGTVGA